MQFKFTFQPTLHRPSARCKPPKQA